ncbi:phage tail collar family protein [Clostridium sp. ASBs410]|nr:phage tail collar family protein [Clostridium sp. ASBs410]
MCEDKKSCITINCGCCSNGKGNDSTPVGTVISYMGTTAPKHYLLCDGSVYNIDDYKEFSQFIKDEHGSFEFFGGDGTTTFAVPDLRGEFLRGTGTGTRDSGTGEAVGVHQEGTRNALTFGAGAYGTIVNRLGAPDENSYPSQVDKYIYSSDGIGHELRADTTARNLSSISLETMYMARPTNTAVLYCIKYE